MGAQRLRAAERARKGGCLGGTGAARRFAYARQVCDSTARAINRGPERPRSWAIFRPPSAVISVSRSRACMGSEQSATHAVTSHLSATRVHCRSHCLGVAGSPWDRKPPKSRFRPTSGTIYDICHKRPSANPRQSLRLFGGGGGNRTVTGPSWFGRFSSDCAERCRSEDLAETQ